MSVDNEKVGVGAIFVSTSTNRVLFNIRSSYKTHAMTWSLFGGMVESQESPKDALLRELSEEMGFVPDIEKIYPFDVYHSNDNIFKYVTFVCIVSEEFIPILNRENCGYCWIDLGNFPKPLHPGARNSFCSVKAINKIKMLIKEHKH
jgi:8-oxo-dGTP pyrophosphatase MutT (NUDIX family)